MVTRYRDLQRPTLLQTGIVDNSAEQKAMALAGAFKGFGRVTSGILGDLNAQQGQQQGAVGGAAGKPQPKTGWRALTRFGESYNSAAEVTYSNKLQTDIHTRLSQIETESEADPVKYQALSESYRDELVKTVPPEYAPRIGQVFDARMAAGNLRVGEQAVQLTQRTALASHLESQPTRIEAAIEAMKGLSREDGDVALGEVIAENGRQIEAFPWLDPVQRLQLEQSFIKDLDAAVAGQRLGSVVEEIGKAARVDVVEADRLVAELETSDQYTPEELTDIRAKVRQQRELLEYERSRLHYKRVAALTQRLSRDEYGVGVEREADSLYRMGAIGDGEYRGYMGRSAENADRVIKANAGAKAAEQVLYVGGPLNPGDPQQVKDVSTAFDNNMALMGVEVGSDRYLQMASQLTKQSNIMPKAVEGWVNVALLSKDPVKAAKAAGFLRDIEKNNPGAYAWAIQPKLSSFSGLLQKNLDAGLGQEAAYEKAFTHVYEIDADEKRIRDEQYTELLKADPHDAYLIDAFTQEVNWGRDKPPPEFSAPSWAALRAEHDLLTRQFYNDSGDITVARDLATAQVKSQWGVTEANGAPELTRYPLERYGFPSDFIQADVKAQVAPLTDRPTRLVQHRLTNQSKGLVWGLQYQKEDGGWELLRGSDNRPRLYTPPMKRKEYDDTAKRIAEADIEDLRRAREAYKAQEALIRPMLSPY